MLANLEFCRRDVAAGAAQEYEGTEVVDEQLRESHLRARVEARQLAYQAPQSVEHGMTSVHRTEVTSEYNIVYWYRWGYKTMKLLAVLISKWLALFDCIIRCHILVASNELR